MSLDTEALGGRQTRASYVHCVYYRVCT